MSSFQMLGVTLEKHVFSDVGFVYFAAVKAIGGLSLSPFGEAMGQLVTNCYKRCTRFSSGNFFGVPIKSVALPPMGEAAGIS